MPLKASFRVRVISLHEDSDLLRQQVRKISFNTRNLHHTFLQSTYRTHVLGILFRIFPRPYQHPMRVWRFGRAAMPVLTFCPEQNGVCTISSSRNGLRLEIFRTLHIGRSATRILCTPAICSTYCLEYIRCPHTSESREISLHRNSIYQLSMYSRLYETIRRTLRLDDNTTPYRTELDHCSNNLSEWQNAGLAPS